MCGITGFLNLHGQAAPEIEALGQMLSSIRHRGPDGVGIYRDHQAALGSVRLSIIDVEGGDQPISNEDGTLWIVYNGEVFNYVELRPELEARGHRFTTQTDTEVVLHLFEDLGPKCLERLNGQFAFAIWDTVHRRLFLARDRLGVRPLYYTIVNDLLIFGSEIKSILAHPAVPAEIDPFSLAQVFTYWSVLPPRSIFRNIQTLPPGSYMLVENGKVEVIPYWALEFAKQPQKDRDPNEILEELESLLIDATCIRLRADVPVGAYLSGGLDSSLITALVRGKTSNRLETFSISFSDPRYDESAYQKQMAEVLGTNHHVVYCRHEEIGQILPEVIWHTETPILRTAPAPMYLLSGLVRDNGLKVVLTGEGADEFLGGYDIFKEMAVRRFWASDPESQLRPMLFKRLYPDIAGMTQVAFAYRKLFFKKGLTDTGSPYYSHDLRWGNTSRLQRFLLNPTTFNSGLHGDLISLPPHFGDWPALSKAQYLEVNTFLSPYLLSSQGDRVAMAHSIEGRYPFLDYRVVEFCNGLAPELKLNGLIDKWILRRIGHKYLPESIWKRPKKPYRAPILRSFFYPGAPEYIRELFDQKALSESGLFQPLPVQQLVDKATTGSDSSELEDMALIGILSMQLVYSQFIKGTRQKVQTYPPSDRFKLVDQLAMEHK